MIDKCELYCDNAPAHGIKCRVLWLDLISVIVHQFSWIFVLYQMTIKGHWPIELSVQYGTKWELPHWFDWWTCQFNTQSPLSFMSLALRSFGIILLTVQLTQLNEKFTSNKRFAQAKLYKALFSFSYPFHLKKWAIDANVHRRTTDVSENCFVDVCMLIPFLLW